MNQEFDLPDQSWSATNLPAGPDPQGSHPGVPPGDRNVSLPDPAIATAGQSPSTELQVDQAVAEEREPSPDKRRRRIAFTLTSARARSIAGRYTILWLLILAVVGTAVTNANFATPSNLLNVLRQSAFVGIGAAGMTFLIIAGAFDLSVAGVLALCAVIAAELILSTGIVAAVLVALLAGVLLGVVNGLVVTKLGVPPFVATLGLGYVYLAIVFIWTKDQLIIISSPQFLALGTGSFLGLPIPFIMLALSCLTCWLIVKYTRYGRFARAIGSNLKASTASGIPVTRVRIFAFAMVGLFTALAGLSLAGQLSSASGTMATGYELQTIAVAVVGGTSLRGGSGTFLGTLAGAVFFTVISNALDLFGLGSYWQYVATGLILILALAIEGMRHWIALHRA
jgi:ribose/xylose/arabinose/galactoside ABC-type transport system permease subunit